GRAVDLTHADCAGHARPFAAVLFHHAYFVVEVAFRVLPRAELDGHRLAVRAVALVDGAPAPRAQLLADAIALGASGRPHRNCAPGRFSEGDWPGGEGTQRCKPEKRPAQETTHDGLLLPTDRPGCAGASLRPRRRRPRSGRGFPDAGPFRPAPRRR